MKTAIGLTNEELMQQYSNSEKIQDSDKKAL